MDPTPEGYIPGPRPRGLGRDNSIGDDGIREMDGLGLVFLGKRRSVLFLAQNEKKRFPILYDIF